MTKTQIPNPEDTEAPCQITQAIESSFAGIGSWSLIGWGLVGVWDLEFGVCSLGGSISESGSSAGH